MEKKTYPEKCIQDETIPCHMFKWNMERTRPCETFPCKMYKDYAASGILFIRVGCRKAGNLDTVNLIEIRTQKTAEEVQAYLQQYFRLGEAPFFQVLENLKAVDGGFTFEIREPYRQ